MIQRLIKQLALLFLCISLLISYIGCTTHGLKMFIQLMTCIMPGKLQIKHIEGTLFHKLILTEIEYENKTCQLSIQQLMIDWNPASLKIGTVFVNALNMKQVRYHFQHSESSRIGNRDNTLFFSLLSHLRMKSMLADDIQVSNDNHLLLNIDHLQLQLGNKASIDIKGAFNHHPIRGLATLDINHAKWGIRQADLFVGLVHLSIAGQLDQQWKMQWTCIVPALNEIIEKAVGSVSCRGTIIGEKYHPQVIASFKGDRLSYETYQFSTQGDLSAKISLSDQYHHFFIHEFSLDNGELFLPKLGMHLSHILLRGLTQDGLSQLKGSFYSGNNQAEIKGTFDPDPLKVMLNLKGKDLKAVDLPQYKIDISPELTFQYFSHHLSINGLVAIPFAEIAPRHLATVVTLPDEVVYVDQDKPVDKWPLNINMQLNLALGKKVHLIYKGLDARLAGQLMIIQQTNKLPIGVGEIHFIDGVYHAYGKTLRLNNSRLIFTNSWITNPGLNIRAIRTIQTVSLNDHNTYDSNQDELQPVMAANEITIGLHITGTAENPVVTLFSLPKQLSQVDILSYLLFGHSRSQLSGQQVTLIMNALSSLSVGDQFKIDKMLDKLSRIADFSIDSTEVYHPATNSISMTPTIGIGKQLLNNLYIHYSVGLFDPISILNLRYKINKRLSIQSESSTMESGVDLLYGFEV